MSPEEELPDLGEAPLSVSTGSPLGQLDEGILLDVLPVAAYVCDQDGVIVRYNHAAALLWGREPRPGDSQQRFCGSWKLYRPDGSALPFEDCPMAVALRERRAIRGGEAVAERPDGTRVAFLAYPTPLFDPEGELRGAVNLLVDVTEQKAAEVATQRLAAIIESSDDAILSKDLNGIITSWNRGATRLFGYAEAETLGRPVTILIPEDRQDEEPAILARIRRGEHIDHYETIRRRKDGSLVDISLSVSPIFDRSGRVVGASKIARDITDRKRAEQQKDLLLAEMKHRVKNLFALSGSLVNLSGRSAGSVPELVSDLQGRFAALARAHALTLPAGPEAEVGQPTLSLHALIASVTQPYEEEADGRVTITGQDLPIGSATATNFALILHEFTTNAVKYGALAQPDGRLCIDCVEEGENVSLVWREFAPLRQMAPPSREGFGSRLARATVGGALGGSFSREFRPDGVEIRLTAPRDRLSR